MQWNGAGVWLIFSQSRQVNFSRTVSMTFHSRGFTRHRARHVLAELAQPSAAAAFASFRRFEHHTLARQMFGERVALGRRRVNGRTLVVFATAFSAASSSAVALSASSSNSSANCSMSRAERSDLWP